MTESVEPTQSGYLSGAQADPDELIVEYAMLAIEMFAGQNRITRADVPVLLHFWYRRAELSDDHVKTLLERYPATPGWAA